MNITILTDASYHSDFKVGGYACWIVGNGRRFTQYGPLKMVKNNINAEIMAVGNALAILLKGYYRPIFRVFIITDCMAVQTRIRETAPKGSPEKYCWDALQKIKRQHQIKRHDFYEIRHVKAHTGLEDLRSSRQYVNDWCDRMAKMALGEEIRRLKKR